MNSHDPARGSRSRASAFTLVELLVVVAIVILLATMVTASVSSATEWARITHCTEILHNIGVALQQYVGENHQHMPPYVWRIEGVFPIDVVPGQWPTDYEYGTAYDYHNLIAPYLGLGNCMPPGCASPNSLQQQDRWAGARYSFYKEFQCPSGTSGITSPYGWLADPKTGGRVSSFYMQNASWLSQTQIQGPEWPRRMAYFPRFTGAAILLYECWSCNAMQPDPEIRAQPYSTHYRDGRQGAEGIGRNILYADWHVEFLTTGSADRNPPFVIVSNQQFISRGNDVGYQFIWPWDGRSYVSWGPAQSLLEKG